MALDDEQGPWWTRPPEPGSQAPQVQRRRTSEPHDVEHPAEQTVAVPAPTEYFRPRLVEPPREEPDSIEPEPAPPPPKPIVRRVAVVPPTPPPVRTTNRAQMDDRTETLPAVGDDIFATFSGSAPTGIPIQNPDLTGPDAAGRGGSGRGGLGLGGFGLGGLGRGRAGSGEPQATGRTRPDGSPDEPPGDLPHRLLDQVKQVNLPEPRVLLLVAAAAMVALLIVVVALVSGRGTKSEPAAQPPASKPSPGAAADLKGKDPTGLKQLSAEDAAAQLNKAGQGPGGSIIEAWGWDDKNGRNLVVTSVATAGSKRTLRVIHIADLDTEPRTLRLMKDPNLPARCKGAGTASFTPKALIVRDLDGNNVAEVISGWTSRCGGADNKSVIKLALITNGDKYILRGQGVIGKAGQAYEPAPRANKWPDGYLKAAGSVYAKLYS